MKINTLLEMSKLPLRYNKKDYPVAGEGCRVHLEFLYRSGESEYFQFRLVPDKMANLGRGLLGISTPLAKAIIDEKVGVYIPFFTEETMAVKILNIEVCDQDLDMSKTNEMKESMEHIRAEIEFREAQLFASSTNTKWGSYDPDSLDFNAWMKARKSSKANDQE